MYKAHLFICTNGSGIEGKCAHKNSEALHKKVKEYCKKTYGDEVRVNKSGCLDYCEKGIAAVLYPKDQWFFDLKESDEAKLIAAVDTVMKA